MKPRIFIIAFLALSPVAHGDLPVPSSYQALIEQCSLTAEVAMAISDDADPVHATRARNHLTSLESFVPIIARRYPGVEADLNESLREQVSSLKDHLLRRGYDTAEHLRFAMAQRTSMSHFMDLVSKEGISNQERMAIEICNVVGNYLLIATSPLGPDNVSAFNNDESDFERRVSSIDAAFDEMSMVSPLAKTLRPKWNFIRPALLDRNHISAPFVVYRSGMAMVNGISGIKEAVSE